MQTCRQERELEFCRKRAIFKNIFFFILQNMTHRTAFHGCINIEGAEKEVDGLPASLTLEPMIEFGKRRGREGSCFFFSRNPKHYHFENTLVTVSVVSLPQIRALDCISRELNNTMCPKFHSEAPEGVRRTELCEQILGN